MDYRKLRDKEVEKLKWKNKQTIKLCKTIWEYRVYIDEIKEAIKKEDYSYAEQLWSEIDFPIQSILITAPTFGGAFSTSERAIVRNFWKVTEEDLSNQFKVDI